MFYYKPIDIVANMITFIVTEYEDNRLSMLGLNLLGVTAIAGIIAVIIGYKIFIIANERPLHFQTSSPISGHATTSETCLYRPLS